MNYEANTETWKSGDLVIHDADAKQASMLMVVLGYTRGGLVRSRYVGERKVYTNELRFLHAPGRFGLRGVNSK